MEQITIITKDYHGLTADITSALGSNDINIRCPRDKRTQSMNLNKPWPIQLLHQPYNARIKPLQMSDLQNDARFFSCLDDRSRISQMICNRFFQ